MEIIFGIISGMVTGMGMGGGSILILLLTTFNGMEQHMAQATNLIYFIPTSLAVTIINLKNKKFNPKAGYIIIVFGIIGAIIGSKIALQMDSKILRKFFAVFLLIIVVNEIYSIYKISKKKKV